MATERHWNTPKEGIGLTTKIVQKGEGDFKLMYAKDLDWGSVNLGNTNISTTDELLDYIEGGISGVGGSGSGGTLQQSVYTIRCSKTVCYAGDEFNLSPKIKVYKYNGTSESLMSWSDIVADGLSDSWEVVKPATDTNATGIFKFDSTDQCLNGTAKVGTYIFYLKKNGGVVASLTISAILRDMEVYNTTIYRSSQTNPGKPVGGSYNFSTDTFNPPTDWSESMEGLTGTIWFSFGSIYSTNSSNGVWSEPSIYFDHDHLDIEHKVANVAVYRTLSSDTTLDSAHYPSGGSYTWTPSETFNKPDHWYLTPQASIDAYKNGTDSTSYVTYVSYNTYKVDVSNGTNYGTTTSLGWTTPVKYLDIDSILSDAGSRAQTIVDDAIAEAQDALETAAALITGDGVASVVNAVNNIYEWTIVDSATGYTTITSSDTTLYSPFGNTYKNSSDQLVGTIAALNADDNICTSSYFNKCILFDSITPLTGSAQSNKYVAYIPSTLELRTQMAQLDTQTNQLKTSVDMMTPDYIKLQVAKGYEDEYLYEEVTQLQYNAVDNSKKHEVSALPTTAYSSTNTSGYVFDHYYKVTPQGKYYKCNRALTTGFLNLLSEKVNLGVANNKTGDNKGALISFGFDSNGSGTADIHADLIILDGDTIAAAIAAKSLNVNNRSYLLSDGTSRFAMNTPGATEFNKEGSGYIASGAISWKNDGTTNILDLYIGSDSRMGWHINGGSWSPDDPSHPELGGFVDVLPSIHSESGSGSSKINFDITPDYIASRTGNVYGSPSVNWTINKDGSAIFAKGNIQFNNDGSCNIGDTNDPSKGSLTMDSDGNVVLHGIAVSISGDQYSQLLAGASSRAQSEIEAELRNPGSSIVGVIADAAAGQVNVLGTLSTQDVTVGNGSCFFKGTDTAHNPQIIGQHYYGENTAGAGHLAKGNIWWDAYGNTTIQGDISATNFKTISETGLVNLEITTVGEAGINDATLQEAGLTDYTDFTPIMVVHDRNDRGEETGRYIVSLTKIANNSTDTTTSVILSNVTKTPSYQDFVDDVPGRTYVTKTVRTENGQVVSTSVSDTGYFYERGNTTSAFIWVTISQDLYALVQAVEIKRHEVFADGTIHTMHTYMIEDATFQSVGSGGGYDTSVPVKSGWFLPKVDQTTGGIEIDDNIAGHRVSIGWGPFNYLLNSGTYGISYGMKGDSINLYNTYYYSASDPAQAPWFEMDVTIPYYNGSGNAPWTSINN